MPAAVSSLLKTSIALAGAGVIALSPVVPTHDARIPTVNLPAIELAGAATPAIGAIPYQIGVNTLGNILALAPILIGSTDQCSVCLGPTSPPSPSPVPFTGYGTIGIAASLIGAPIAFFKVLQSEGFGQALGAAALALQVPISNTLTLLGVPRAVGGFDIVTAADRAYSALRDSVNGALDITYQALFTGPLTVIKGGVTAGLAFAEQLALTGNLIDAINAGRALFQPAVNKALTDLTGQIDAARTQVYTDLTGPPGVAKSPIPPAAAVSASTRPAAAAAAEDTGGPVAKVTDSVRALPARTAASESGSKGSAGAASDDQGSSASAPKARRGAGQSRAHRAAA